MMMNFKIGDRVRVKWTQERKHTSNFVGLSDAKGLSLDGEEGIVEDCGHNIDVKFDNGDLFFIPVDCLELILNMNIISLKDLNTKADATVCVACGSLLKNPTPWILSMKYCPKCEP